MSDFATVLKITAYLLALIFGVHFTRTLAFNRYEAVTFECSSVAVLVSLLLIWKCGVSPRLALLFAVLLAAFFCIAFAQWHFYMNLQDIIKKAFEPRTAYLKKHGADYFVTETLSTMASVAVMPSFSRFIEESKLFNNPGGFIGLIKSIMKRQRFQKKKYLMRESFAENVDLIGPCQPMIESPGPEREGLIPAAVHANDLALGYKDEKAGLLSFDILGFGALAAIFLILLRSYLNPNGWLPTAGPTWDKTVLMCLAAGVFTLVSHCLRHFAFARYESVCYELSFTALVIVSFRVFDGFMTGTLSTHSFIILGLTVLVFLTLSCINRHQDRALHRKINQKYDEIMDQISLEYETDRAKRRFLRNLKLISEWAVVPFPGSKASSDFFKRVIPVRKLREFEEINQKKQDMPHLTEELIDRIVPEFSRDVTEEDFRLTRKQVISSQLITRTLSALCFVGVFVCIGLGLL